MLAGECVVIVEGEERPLRQWDLFHCPPGVPHTIVGAGDGPALVLAVGARGTGEDQGLVYPVDPVAQKHGAGVDKETSLPDGGVRGHDPRLAHVRVPGAWLRQTWTADQDFAAAVELRPSWPSRRTSCTRRWTSSSRGRSARSPSTCGRSTCTGCTRTTASSSRSSSRFCSTATSSRAGTCSIRSPAPGRRSCRRSSPGSTRPAPSSPRSTASSSASRRRATTSTRSARSCATPAAGSSRSISDRVRAPREPYLRAWYSPRAAAELFAFRDLIDAYEHRDVLRVILSRAARSVAPRRALRSRGAARAADRRVLVLQASPDVPSGRVRGRLSPPLHARHADAHRGVRARARRRTRGARPPRRLAERRLRRTSTTASSRHRRIRG